MEVSLENKVAVISGASHGLGRAVAETLAAAGAHTALIARRAQPLQETADAIGAAGGAASVYACDVADSAHVRDTAAAIQTAFGKVDILINNAGIPAPRSFEDTDISDWDEVIGVNLSGVFYLTRALVEQPLRRRFGLCHQYLGHCRLARRRQPGLRGQQIRLDRPEPRHRASGGGAQYPLDHSVSGRHGHGLARRAHRRPAPQRVYGPAGCCADDRPARNDAGRIRRQRSGLEPA